MTRREFLQTTGACIAGAMIPLSLMTKHQRAPEAIVVHPETYKTLRGKENFRPATQIEILQKSLYGRLDDQEVYVSTVVPKGVIRSFTV